MVLSNFHCFNIAIAILDSIAPCKVIFHYLLCFTLRAKMSNNFGRAITTYTEINTEKNFESMYKI